MVDRPDLVEKALGAYFATLKYYQKDPVRLAEAIAEDAKVPVETAQKIAGGIRFVNLPDNAFHWFGVGGPDATERVSRIVSETIDIQKAQGRLASNPLKDPFTIINRMVLERAMKSDEGVLTKKFQIPVKAPEPAPKETPSYRLATAQEWESADKVGTLDVAPIYFSAGSTELAREDREYIDDVARKVAHYPKYRLKIVGHTSPGGDAKASLSLSEERAGAVAEYLVKSHGIVRDRIFTVGKGGGQPLARRPGEPFRGYAQRCQRVEFVLVLL
jgi:outer membrane protein OmpA-like peptidoglycan-associated protein